MKKTLIFMIPDEKLEAQLKCLSLMAPRRLLFIWLDKLHDLFDYLNRQTVDVVAIQAPKPVSEFAYTVQQLREITDASIFAFIEGNDLDDLTFCLDLVDDGMQLPLVSENELIARTRALLKHPNSSIRKASKQDSIITLRSLVLHKHARRVFVNRHEVALTKTQFNILLYLMENEDITISKEQIYSEIWKMEDEIDVDETVRSHIKKLRKAIKRYAKEEIIETVRGVGYRINSKGTEQLSFGDFDSSA